MKVIKHCSQAFPTPATGFLVGMDKNATLEVTNAFPFPTVETPPTDGYHDHNTPANLASSAPRAKANILYQTEMIRKLREVNVDANNTGWYTSTNLGHFMHSTFLENQYHYQKEMNERTVAIVHDVSRSSQGSLSLRAFRLSPSFMTAFKENRFTAERYPSLGMSHRSLLTQHGRSLQKSSLRYQDILLELPLQIHNSHLLTSFLHSLPTTAPSSEAQLSQPPTLQSLAQVQDPLSPNFTSLNLSIDPFLTQTTDLLLDSIETHHTELNNYQYYQRQLAREQAKISAWQTKRKSENASRAMAKQNPLPEDEWQRLFKLPQEPGRLDTLLNSRQVEQYARQVDGFTAAVTGKMFAVKGNLLPGAGEE